MGEVSFKWRQLVGLGSMILLGVVGFSGCLTLQPSTTDPNFTSALYNILSYARQELGHNFSADGCEGCEVRVIRPQMIERYLNLQESGFEGEIRQQIEKAIRENKVRALVMTNLKDHRNGGAITNLVFLPVQEGALPGFDDVNGVLLSNAVAAGCGFRSFGQRGTKHWCAVCAVGLCCGACKCTACGGDLTSAMQSLDLPKPLARLFDGPVALDAYQLDTNLVRN